MDYCPWTQSMPSRDVNAATRLAEAMYSPSSGFTGMGQKNMPNLVTYEQWFYEQDKQEAQRVPYIAPEYHQEMCKDFL